MLQKIFFLKKENMEIYYELKLDANKDINKPICKQWKNLCFVQILQHLALLTILIFNITIQIIYIT